MPTSNSPTQKPGILIRKVHYAHKFTLQAAFIVLLQFSYVTLRYLAHKSLKRTGNSKVHEVCITQEAQKEIIQQNKQNAINTQISGILSLFVYFVSFAGARMSLFFRKEKELKETRIY